MNHYSMCNSEHAWDQLKKKKEILHMNRKYWFKCTVYIKWHFKLASKNKVVYMEMHIDLSILLVEHWL